MNLGDILKKEADKKLTENYAVAYSTIGSPLLDLFGVIGSLRSRSEEEIIEMFENTLHEDVELALKMVFYAGDIREGLGERRTFQILIKHIATKYPFLMKENFRYIPFFNRWDSIFQLKGTPLEKDMWSFVKDILILDCRAYLRGDSLSLLAKWLPSLNASSPNQQELAKEAHKQLGLRSEKDYRKTLSLLRARLNIVEQKMSANQWEDIDYSTTPSVAMNRYSGAFIRHDEEGMVKFLEEVKAGKKTINAKVLYPYDLVSKVRKGEYNDIVEEQWKALPDYIDGDDSNILVMADVSGSMTCANGRPMDTSVGLAIYFAERNTGMFKNCFMTYTDIPKIVKMNPRENLKQKVFSALKHVGYDTNLELAFNTILKLALDNNIVPNEMPKALVVISDMEINNYIQYRGLDFVETMKRKFQSHGYSFPKLVCVNVEARQNTFLSQSPDVLLISGQGVSMFKSILNGIEGTSWELMEKTLRSPRYDRIKVS